MHGAGHAEGRCAALRVSAAVRTPHSRITVPPRKRARPNLVVNNAYTYDEIPLRATDSESSKRIMIFDLPDGLPAPAPPLVGNILSTYNLSSVKDAQLHVFPSELETRGLRLQMHPAPYRDKQFGQILFLCGQDAHHVPFAMARRYGAARGASGNAADLYAHIQDDETYANLMRAWPALWAQLLAVGAALCSGGAGARSIVHNDIKPENLVVEAWDADRVHLRLIDFDHAWPFDLRVQQHVSYGCRAHEEIPSSFLCVADNPVGCTPAYAAPPLQPAFRGMGLPWNVQGVDAWSIANTAFFAFTRSLLAPKAVAQMLDMPDHVVSRAPHFTVLAEVLDQIRARQMPYRQDLVVPWTPSADMASQAQVSRAASASAIISLQDVRDTLAQHTHRFGDTEQAQRAARDVGLLFELCSLLAIGNTNLRAAHAAFQQDPPAHPLSSLVEFLRAPPSHTSSSSSSSSGDSALSVWDVLRLS